MATIQLRGHSCLNCTLDLLTVAWRIGATLKSLFYNEFADKYYIGDTCMEPMLWIVDHFTKVLGPICVAGVLVLMTSMIAVAYIIGLPYWWKQSPVLTVILLIFGHWILVNVLFHYYMAYTTLPGYPPQGALIPEAVSICKKCIAPKPPRTHHCSICNVCVLKMDHHCPWLNNCIGHFNHRYFFMFCLYVWVGIIFIMIFGLPIAWEHFMLGEEPLNSVTSVESMKRSNNHSELSISFGVNSTDVECKRSWSQALYHSCIVYAALLSIAVFVAVGCLLMWHSNLISKGETSIEGHINKKERCRLSAEGKVFKNPYDYSLKKNWVLFFGANNGRILRYILFPSAHEPVGNGLQWHVYDSVQLEDTKRNKLKS